MTTLASREQAYPLEFVQNNGETADEFDQLISSRAPLVEIRIVIDGSHIQIEDDDDAICANEIPGMVPFFKQHDLWACCLALYEDMNTPRFLLYNDHGNLLGELKPTMGQLIHRLQRWLTRTIRAHYGVNQPRDANAYHIPETGEQTPWTELDRLYRTKQLLTPRRQS